MILGLNISVIDNIKDVIDFVMMNWESSDDVWWLNIDVRLKDINNYNRCHDTGKKVWYMKSIIDSTSGENHVGYVIVRGRNVGCKVFGTTATNIRNSDKRDMSIELFGGNIASMIGIGDAIKNNILPKPLYIRGLYTFDKVFNEKCDLINRSNKISSGEKSRRIERLKKMRKDWNCDCGIVNILKKHLYGSYVKKMIIFCDRVDSLDVMRDKISEWFRDSGLVLDCIDMVHHKLSGKVVNEKITKFRSYNGDGISVMLAVNMLNEGIHVHGVDCVMFLRKTNSNIIYLQQMGRSLITNAENKPIILDLVDNFTNKDEDVSFGNGNGGCSNSGLSKVRSFLADFEVIDYIVDIRELINGLTSDLALNLQDKYIPLDERIDMIERFINVNGRPPMRSVKSERDDSLNWFYLCQYFKNNERVRELKFKYGSLQDKEVAKKRIIDFMNNNKRVPSCAYTTKGSIELNYGRYITKHKDELFLDKEFKETYEKYYYSKRPYFVNGEYDFDKLIKILSDFCVKNNGLPVYNQIKTNEYKIPRNAYNILRKKFGDRYEFLQLVKKYSKVGVDKTINKHKANVVGYTNSNGYLPIHHEFGEYNPAARSWSYLQKHVNDSDSVKLFVEEMKLKYGRATELKKEENKNRASEARSALMIERHKKIK